MLWLGNRLQAAPQHANHRGTNHDAAFAAPPRCFQLWDDASMRRRAAALLCASRQRVRVPRVHQKASRSLHIQLAAAMACNVH